VFSNRIEKKLVNLSGTVPVTFKGNYQLILICNIVIKIIKYLILFLKAPLITFQFVSG